MSRIVLKPTTDRVSLVTLCKLGQTGGGPSPGGGGSGWIIINDIAAQGGGVVSSKTYQDMPNNTVLQSCATSNLAIVVAVRSSYPQVEVGPVSATLSRDVSGGFYAGNVSLTMPTAGILIANAITPDSSIGATDSVAIALDAPPELLTLQFAGGYPGSQTELKAGDSYQLVGTLDKPGNALEVQNYGAGTSQLLTFPTGLSFAVTMTIANRGTSTQALAARARARNVAGAFGGLRDTNTGGGTVDGVNLVNLNNLHPTVTFGSVAYPGSQQALKGVESATVAVTTSDLNTIAYTSPPSEVSITNPTLDEPVKTVTRTGGTYNVSVPNLRAEAIRAANDAHTVTTGVINIAAVAAVVSVNEPAARLRSGGNNGTSAQDHTISIVSDQRLLNAPSVDSEAGGGVWQGGGFTGGPSTWTRAIRVHDNDTKGTYSWSNLVATNLAGIVTTAITGSTTYVLGGFVARTLTFAAFSQTVVFNAAVVDYSKLTAGIFTATDQPALRNATQGNHSNILNTFTVDSIGTNPTTLWWNDVAAASSNSGGTAQITNVQETV